MKPTDEESFSLLSKNNAKILLVRNAKDQATLKKETRLLEKERNSEERSFLKTRERLLQQQSARIEISKRPLSSCSLQLAEKAVAKWRSGTSLAQELSPKLRRKEMDDNHKMQTSLSSSLPLLSDGTAKQSSPLSRRKALSPLTASSLPDIHITSNGTSGGSGTMRTSQLSNKKLEILDTKASVTDDWKELQKCRYLRTHSMQERV